jgi:S-adenosylmethionine synthetase
MKTDYLFSSESVTEGHPDKVADRISDSVLDEIIAQDTAARVACETFVTTGLVFIAGEITTSCYVEMPEVARNVVKDIGYNSSSMGFDWETCAVLTSIDRQSPDIAMGVNGNGEKEQGAGDQGIMFGYACDETPEFMPMPIDYAHKLTMGLATARKDGTLDFLRPDGKSQVTVEYKDDKPSRIEAVVIAAQHSPEVSTADLKEGVMEEVIRKLLPGDMLDEKTKYFINTTGRFVVGGPLGDAGMTGRKIIVDTYGGQGSHGGGCFSGKDPSKVDRSACYMARHIAKNIVAAGLARKCEVQLAYSIGIARPISILVHTFGTGIIPSKDLTVIVDELFDLRPAAIIEYLDLLRPIYKKTSAYGHFGRTDPDFTWERTNMVDVLKDRAGV